jgi:hypothetical protein
VPCGARAIAYSVLAAPPAGELASSSETRNVLKVKAACGERAVHGSAARVRPAVPSTSRNPMARGGSASGGSGDGRGGV